MTDHAAVNVEDVTHHYGSRVALDHVTFHVGAGEIFALLGPNGGGKTTLFKILATLLAPTSGHAAVFGLDVRAQAPRVRERIGVTFQSPSVDRKLTVQENLRHCGHMHGMRGRGLSARMDRVLEALDLGARRRERVDRLSGGLMRRVEIANCMLHEPDLLLLDEPSSGLDPTARRGLGALLDGLRRRRGTSCLLTTHVMDEADACDRIGILDRGRLVAAGAPETLKDEIGGDVLTVWARDPVSLSTRIKTRFDVSCRLLGHTIRIEHPRGYELAARLAEAFPDELDKVAVGRPTLDDVFARATGHLYGGADDEREASEVSMEQPGATMG